MTSEKQERLVASQEPGDVQIPISWVGLDEAPIIFANQFLIQHQPNEFVISVGQLAPPPLLGTPEEQQKQAQHLDFVPVKTLARVGLTRGRLVELIQALQANLDNHDTQMRKIDPR